MPCQDSVCLVQSGSQTSARAIILSKVFFLGCHSGTVLEGRICSHGEQKKGSQSCPLRSALNGIEKYPERVASLAIWYLWTIYRIRVAWTSYIMHEFGKFRQENNSGFRADYHFHRVNPESSGSWSTCSVYFFENYLVLINRLTWWIWTDTIAWQRWRETIRVLRV